MQGQAPTCPRCGAIVTNPGAASCAYCQSPLAQAQAQAPAYGGYNQAAPPPYGAPPQQQQYGAPNPYAQNPYGQPPPGAYPGYGPQQQPYGVQPFGGANHGYRNVSAWNNGGFWNIFWMIRLGIALLIVGGMLMAACLNAIAH